MHLASLKLLEFFFPSCESVQALTVHPQSVCAFGPLSCERVGPNTW